MSEYVALVILSQVGLSSAEALPIFTGGKSF